MSLPRVALLVLFALFLRLPSFAQVTNSLPTLSVHDTPAILAQKGNEIEVHGTVREAFWVRKQTLLITFRPEHEGFLAVAFAKDRSALDEAFGGDLARAVKGKAVRIRGTVTLHNERPQIVVRDPAQLSLDEPVTSP